MAADWIYDRLLAQLSELAFRVGRFSIAHCEHRESVFADHQLRLF